MALGKHAVGSPKSPVRDSRITRLPIELVVMISDHLDKSSLKNFASTCRFIASAVGTVWISMALTDVQRGVFLALRERYFPDERACLVCLTLHDRAAGGEKAWTEPWGDQCNGTLGRTYNPRHQSRTSAMIVPGCWLHRRHVQHAMALWRLGEPVDLGRFAFYTARGHSAPASRDRPTEFDVSARIINGEFILQKVYRAPAAVAPVHAGAAFPRQAQIAGEHDICSHVRLRPTGLFGPSWSPPMRLDEGAVACNKCAADYYIWTPEDNLVEIRSWHNLGDGIKLSDFCIYDLLNVGVRDRRFRVGSVFKAWIRETTAHSEAEARCKELTWPEGST